MFKTNINIKKFKLLNIQHLNLKFTFEETYMGAFYLLAKAYIITRKTTVYRNVKIRN